ncbi:ABC transporter ATP-binding protein, partial [Rhizobiaceae sp. 2RAB30]
VRRRLVEAAGAGAGVLLISSDLDELMELSTSMVVIYSGRIVGKVNADEYDPERFGLLMAGAPSVAEPVPDAEIGGQAA